MRIFTNPVSMIKEVERDLVEMGTRYQSATVQDKNVADNPDFQTIELIGYDYMLTREAFHDEAEVMQTAIYTGYLKGKEEWLIAEAWERIMGATGVPANPGNSWRKNEELWGTFLRNGLFSYTYSERWREQIPYVIQELKDHPNTRQAILTMYDRHQDMMNWGGLDRVPCSISYQFLIREGYLVCIYNQRSCDFVKFFGADLYLTLELMAHISREINVPIGQFIHFIGSLHAFAGDLKGKVVF